MQLKAYTKPRMLHHNHLSSRMASLLSHAVLLYLRKYNDKSFNLNVFLHVVYGFISIVSLLLVTLLLEVRRS